MLREALQFFGFVASAVPAAMLVCVVIGWLFPSKASGVSVPNFPDPNDEDHSGPY